MFAKVMGKVSWGGAVDLRRWRCSREMCGECVGGRIGGDVEGLGCFGRRGRKVVLLLNPWLWWYVKKQDCNVGGL